MSNEKQLTPIGEAIKHTKDRIRDLKGLQEEKTGFERGQLSHRIHELELQQKALQSILPKEEKEIKTDVEFLCKWCSNEKLMNIFQEEAQEMQDTLAWKKALLETFKTESNATTDTDN